MESDMTENEVAKIIVDVAYQSDSKQKRHHAKAQRRKGFQLKPTTKVCVLYWPRELKKLILCGFAPLRDPRNGIRYDGKRSR
jgi:hypothetical protein